MIEAIKGFLTNQSLAAVAQNTNAAVSIETSLKAIGRPSFILADNSIDYRTKKYAAAKEFLYQATCLAIYMLLVVPVFKRGFFNLAKNYIFKDEKIFTHFKSASEYLNYRKLASKRKINRVHSLEKTMIDGTKLRDKYDNFLQAELCKETPDKFPIVKGAIELGSTIGSVLGLAIIAPQVSHLIVHPMLKLTGLEDKNQKKQTAETSPKLNTKA